MIISHKYKFIFIKTRKTAGTSIEVYLSQFCGENDILTPIHPPVDSHTPRNFDGYSNHMSANSVRDLVGNKIWNEYFVFCVERNPWDKAVSYYCMQKNGQYSGRSFQEYLSIEGGCSDYDAYVDKKNRVIVDKILKYENLNKELSEIFQKLGVPFNGSLDVYAKSKYRQERKRYQEHFSDRYVRLVGRSCYREIRLLDYEFDNTKSKKFVCVHSLFRSGRTYIFHKIRESKNNLYCYQEPLNEQLLNLEENLPDVSNIHTSLNFKLRHPHLKKPYFYEFFPISHKVSLFLKESLCYKNFFDKKDLNSEMDSYMTVLINGAGAKMPVLQMCRSFGRLENFYKGVNIFLWRNPWDQWWSYKVDRYFCARTLMMLNANNLPSFLSDVRNKVNFTPFVGKSLQQEIDHFDEVFLDSKNSYFVFYAVWIYSLLEGNAKANFLVNIDKLSTSSQYRSHISKEFEKIGVFHIDFSDCHSPLGSFSRKDESFFEEIEKEVYEILLDSYSHEQIAEVLKLKEEFLPARKKKNYHDSFLEIANLRDVALRGDEALSNSYQKTSINLDFQKKLQRKVGELSQKLEDLHRDNERINDRYHSIVRSRSWRMMKLTHPFADVIKSIFFTNRGRYKDLKPSSPNNKEFIVDITHIYKKDLKTGIQRVVRAVLSEFETLLSKEWELRVVYLGSNNMYKYCDSKKILVPKKGDVFLGLDLNSRISQCETMFEVWRNAGVRLNFVVYDILPILYPEWWDFDVSIAHKRWLRSVLKYSDSVACISQVVADEVIEFCSLDSCPENISKKVHSFHLGANLESSSPSVGIPEGFAEHKVNMLRYDTFLMVGTVEPRKGHLEVLEAFNWLWAKNHKVNLIIVGKPGWMMDEFLLRIKSHALLGQSLFYYDRASDEFLEVLYKESTCLIAASKAEGFGLPLIEAARYGLPIIARDIPIFREVAGEFATYFSDDKLSSVVLSWLDSYRNNAHIHSKGMGFYSWEESSKQMLSILKT